MKKIWCYSSLTLTICLSLLINSCEFTSTSISRAGEEKEKIDNMLIQQTQKSQNLPISAQLLINDQKIDLEVASTPEQQQIGLMYRSSLSDDRGMLFPFKKPILASFWMKNVNISLDMIFLKDGIVDSIAHNVPPCKQDPCSIYYSDGFINQVIELAGGRAQELNIQPGDHLDIILLNLDTKN